MANDPQLEKIDKQIAQLKARKSAIKQRQKAANGKRETQRKVIIGGTVLKHAELHPEFHDRLWQLLNQNVRRPYDRTVLGLSPLPLESTAAE